MKYILAYEYTKVPYLERKRSWNNSPILITLQVIIKGEPYREIISTSYKTLIPENTVLITVFTEITKFRILSLSLPSPLINWLSNCSRSWTKILQHICYCKFILILLLLFNEQQNIEHYFLFKAPIYQKARWQMFTSFMSQVMQHKFKVSGQRIWTLKSLSSNYRLVAAQLFHWQYQHP